MPTSGSTQISTILQLAQNISPTSILDIGIGLGKYGFLCREYLDVSNERLSRSEWTTTINGIEIFERYRNPVWGYYYDAVYIGDALTSLGDMANVDLVLLIDVIEHLPKDEGELLLRRCLSTGKYVLFSTPRLYHEQDEVFGNAHEVHRSHWSTRDLKRMRVPMVVFPNSAHLICLLSDARIPPSVSGFETLVYDWANIIRVDLRMAYRRLPRQFRPPLRGLWRLTAVLSGSIRRHAGLRRLLRRAP